MPAPAPNLPAVIDSTSSFSLLPAAHSLAGTIANTDFVPRALRGKPEAVLACILTGNELGVGPMQSLSKIHVIEGRPSMAAELMRAVIIRDGHDLWVEESNNTRCVLGTRRAGSSRDQTFTYTIDDAKQAGLSSKDNWRKYPRAMLLARATGELARAVYPDILAGISFTSEELTDGTDADIEDTATPPARTAKRAAARTAKATRPATRPAAPAAGDEPPLPGEDGDVTGPRLSGPQMVAMRFNDRGITDRDERLQIIGAIVGHEISSSKDLSIDEIGRVLGVLDDDAQFEEVAYAETVDADDAGSVTADEELDEAPVLARPADAAGWRDLLRAHRKRVVDALMVTGTANLEDLNDEQADALLLWLGRES